MRIRESLTLAAAVAGILAGSALVPGCTKAKAKEGPAAERNGCGGPNGCGGKKDGKDKDKHKCGSNGCGSKDKEKDKHKCGSNGCGGKDKEKDKGKGKGKDKHGCGGPNGCGGKEKK